MPHNYSNCIFCIQNRACEYTKNFQTTFLVKGPSLYNLEAKVTECLEILVGFGYGGTEYLTQNSPVKFSIYKDGSLVCFSDIWWWTEVVGENYWAANNGSSFYVVCDIIDAALGKLSFKRNNSNSLLLNGWLFIISIEH